MFGQRLTLCCVRDDIRLQTPVSLADLRPTPDPSRTTPVVTEPTPSLLGCGWVPIQQELLCWLSNPFCSELKFPQRQVSRWPETWYEPWADIWQALTPPTQPLTLFYLCPPFSSSCITMSASTWYTQTWATNVCIHHELMFARVDGNASVCIRHCAETTGFWFILSRLWQSKQNFVNQPLLLKSACLCQSWHQSFSHMNYRRCPEIGAFVFSPPVYTYFGSAGCLAPFMECVGKALLIAIVGTFRAMMISIQRGGFTEGVENCIQTSWK